MGLLSLSESSVAEKMQLADWQKAGVARWKSKLDQATRSDNPDQMRRDAEKSIRGQISDSQFAMWQHLIGRGDTPATVEVPEQVSSSAVAGMAEPGNAESNSKIPVEDIQLRINFKDAPYDDVIYWLAEQADLALMGNVVPPSTFTYRDLSRTYSVRETMDKINSSLLSSGYQLIRVGRTLRCYDLEAVPDDLERGIFLREIAPVVGREQLSEFGDFEPVTCTFALKRLDPTELKEDVEQLLSIQGRVDAVPATGDLMVTDVARKVKAIDAMIQRAEQSGGSTVQFIELEHITADEVLVIARPLLGLEEDTNTSDDIKISADLFGTQIVAKGQAEKVQDLRDIVEQFDVPPAEGQEMTEQEAIVLRSHKVGQMGLDLAYDIIAQQLAGIPGVRLAKDEKGNQLFAQARPSEHEMIEKSLGLAGNDAEETFKAITVTGMDVQTAIAAVEKFFPETGEEGESSYTIDGQTLGRQVWLRGSAAKIAQIEAFLNSVEASQPASPWGDQVTQIPLTGRAADQALEQAAQMWKAVGGKASIRVIKSGGQATGTGIPQKVFAPNTDDKEAFNLRKLNALPLYGGEPQPMLKSGPQGMLVSTAQEESETETAVKLDPNDIQVIKTPSGLLLYSEDKEQLAMFNEMLNMLAIPSGTAEPTIVYLKNVKAEDAKVLLENVMSGTVDSGGGGSLLGDALGGVMGGMGGMLGAAFGGGGGGLLSSTNSGSATGDYKINTFPLHNALIIEANPVDMDLIEALISTIDIPQSPVNVETGGMLKMIPVVTKDVGEVLAIVKELFSDQIKGAAPTAGGGGGRGGQPDPAAIINALRGGGRGRGGAGGGQTQLTEAKIAISAEPSTNMLIVMAQPQQIEQIEALVKVIDAAGEADPEEIAVTDMGSLKGNIIANGLVPVLGPNAKTNVTESGTSSNTSTSSSATPAAGGTSDAAAQARRAAFFEALRARGGFGGAGRGGGGPGGAGGGGPGGAGRGGAGFGRGGGGPGGGGAGGGGGPGRGRGQ